MTGTRTCSSAQQARRHGREGFVGEPVTVWSKRLVLACACGWLAWSGSAPKIRFADVTRAAGLGRAHRTRRFPGPHGDVLRMFTSGGAAAAAGDFDGDGLEDLFVTDSDAGRPN